MYKSQQLSTFKAPWAISRVFSHIKSITWNSTIGPIYS